MILKDEKSKRHLFAIADDLIRMLVKENPCWSTWEIEQVLLVSEKQNKTKNFQWSRANWTTKEVYKDLLWFQTKLSNYSIAKFYVIFQYIIINTLEICFIGCLNIHGTHVTANNSINDNVVFFFVSDLKIVYYNNY